INLPSVRSVRGVYPLLQVGAQEQRRHLIAERVGHRARLLTLQCLLRVSSCLWLCAVVAAAAAVPSWAADAPGAAWAAGPWHRARRSRRSSGVWWRRSARCACAVTALPLCVATVNWDQGRP